MATTDPTEVTTSVTLDIAGQDPAIYALTTYTTGDPGKAAFHQIGTVTAAAYRWIRAAEVPGWPAVITVAVQVGEAGESWMTELPQHLYPAAEVIVHAVYGLEHTAQSWALAQRA